MDRLKEKLARAGAVVARATAKIEAEADSLIAREEKIEQRAKAAFAPHHSLLDSHHGELDKLEDALRLVSNAPLPSSEDIPPEHGTRNSYGNVIYK